MIRRMCIATIEDALQNLSRYSSNFNANLACRCKLCSKDGHVTKHKNFTNPTQRMDALWKIVFQPHLSNLLND